MSATVEQMRSEFERLREEQRLARLREAGLRHQIREALGLTDIDPDPAWMDYLKDDLDSHGEPTERSNWTVEAWR